MRFMCLNIEQLMSQARMKSRQKALTRHELTSSSKSSSGDESSFDSVLMLGSQVSVLPLQSPYSVMMEGQRVEACSSSKCSGCSLPLPPPAPPPPPPAPASPLPSLPSSSSPPSPDSRLSLSPLVSRLLRLGALPRLFQLERLLPHERGGRGERRPGLERLCERRRKCKSHIYMKNYTDQESFAFQSCVFILLQLLRTHTNILRYWRNS